MPQNLNDTYKYNLLRRLVRRKLLISCEPRNTRLRFLESTKDRYFNNNDQVCKPLYFLLPEMSNVTQYIVTNVNRNIHHIKYYLYVFPRVTSLLFPVRVQIRIYIGVFLQSKFLFFFCRLRYFP